MSKPLQGVAYGWLAETKPLPRASDVALAHDSVKDDQELEVEFIPLHECTRRYDQNFTEEFGLNHTSRCPQGRTGPYHFPRMVSERRLGRSKNCSDLEKSLERRKMVMTSPVTPEAARIMATTTN